MAAPTPYFQRRIWVIIWNKRMQTTLYLVYIRGYWIGIISVCFNTQVLSYLLMKDFRTESLKRGITNGTHFFLCPTSGIKIFLLCCWNLNILPYL